MSPKAKTAKPRATSRGTKKSEPSVAPTKCDTCGVEGQPLSYANGNAVCSTCAATTPAATTKKQSKTKDAPTLRTACEGYHASILERGASDSTARSYKAELTMAMDEIGADTPLASLTPERLDAYFKCDRVTKTRAGESKNVLSIQKSTRVISQALGWAVENKLIVTAPIPA